MSKPLKTVRNPAAQHGSQPSPHEVNALVALFNQGRYLEGEVLSRKLTRRFPQQGVGWKVLGAMLQSQGRTTEAIQAMQKAAALLPQDEQVHSNLGVALGDMNRLPESEACHRRALTIKPDSAPIHSNLGNALKKQGRLSEAESSYRRALAIKPDYADALNNLGVTLMEQDRFLEAQASYRQALAIKPDFAEAYNNLGITLMEQGRLPEAEASYRQALAIKPDYAEAYNNLGANLREQTRFPEAVTCCKKALAVKPGYVEALNNLASLLLAEDTPIVALAILDQSLQIKEDAGNKSLFVDCVKRLQFMHADNSVRGYLVRALSEPWGRPTDLTRVGADIVKLDRSIGECVARADKAWPRRLAAQEIFGLTGLAATSSDELLRCLMTSAPICSLELERFLTMARHTMLDAANGATATGDVAESILGFYGALAQQCFINEYIFDLTDDEADRAQTLRDALAAALQAGGDIPAIWLIAVAAYFPLHSIPLADRLLDRSWSEAVTAVLLQQVCEPAEERQYRADLALLTSIEDEMSQLVRNQYEDNPYPRWIKVEPAGKPRSVDAVLRQKFPSSPLQPAGQSSTADILIAGCGTGQHSIGSAQRFAGARVLAIDLSLSSLCYAKRKTQELGLSMVEYAQADILKLGSLGRCFDVIEACGVLHHLADPKTGWQVLLSLLRPGGFMRLGFYSELARRDIARVRAFIAEEGYGSTVKDIRRCRQDLANLDSSANFGFAVRSGDFFSTSACRDLLFHVQEHRMTLPGIDAFLRENALRLLGFELDAHVLQAYRRRFPADHSATNLGNWHAFESENPDTFLGMYQFWVQKPLSSPQPATNGYQTT